MSSELHLSTRALHADRSHSGVDVTCPLHVSTTYEYGQLLNDQRAVQQGYLDSLPEPSPGAQAQTTASPHIYSRQSIESRERLEVVLGAIEGPEAHAVTYASGLAAIYAAFLFYQPRRVFISKEGYHGTHSSLQLYARGRDHVQIIHLEDAPSEFQPGDMIWLESPQNPRGEIYDVEYYVKARPKGAIVAVDATFSPPPLVFNLKHGVDVVMHSTTKFLGGHSDLLGGSLVVPSLETAQKLRADRTALGSVMGNMEAWLLLRSLRSLNVRVLQQSRSATAIAQWLNSRLDGTNNNPEDDCLSIVEKVWHGSIPGHPGHEVAKRLGMGHSGVFSVELTNASFARVLPRHLRLFVNATSLGGVESLIEWRAVQDPQISPKLCRVSVGLEDVEDLKHDLRQAFGAILREAASS
ncbi:Cys/Met metabolism PLP-dependent enzyme-domain-containing protein [Polychytrium aggregatum]|uniref:Cys/Met metabolism PLP-dependent enzyme-domain-containing protein n=1 Tax=Polychytrium aggregatum TaxID=110093 RepID=UPI0022FDC8A7|nr:Cys/Met metabolism PLP-dependent enzyme-domain-containing protein [Polychytrium aggregatum]KAI9203267.1 Cys/Met metabolism PLP-dependent enzyme-domain-containing protein [Polychytrium aggregatum]